MKKILLLIVWSLFIWTSFWNWVIDKCCIVETIEYKKHFKKTKKEILEKYPSALIKADSYVRKFAIVINNNKKYSNKKAKIYKKLSNKIIDYIYNNWIREDTKSFLFFSYIAYNFYDLYKYEKDSLDYNFENIIENL